MDRATKLRGNTPPGSGDLVSAGLKVPQLGPEVDKTIEILERTLLYLLSPLILQVGASRSWLPSGIVKGSRARTTKSPRNAETSQAILHPLESSQAIRVIRGLRV